MMYKKYKLHPVSAVINFIKGLKELIIPFLIIAVANGFKIESNDFWEYIPLLIFLLVLIFYLISGFIRWWTFVYWFEENELRVEYGLFIKKKRYIPFDRIQSFNYKESIFHRIFGLVQVMVETAGSTDGKPEVVLTAITREEASQIERETKKVNIEQISENEFEDKNQLEAVEVQQDLHEIIYKISAKDLFLLATTSNSIGVVIAGVAAFISQVSEFIPYERIFEELSIFIQFGFMLVLMTIFFTFLMAWIVSIIITFINYYDFTVVQENDRIVITRGLLEKKRITIPKNRVQGIKIVENPIRQMVKYATVVVESASGGFGEHDKKIMLFPIISNQRMLEPLRQLFPHFDFEMEPDFIRPPKKAKPHFYRIDILWLLPIIGLCSYFFYPLGLFSILFVLPVLMLRLWQYKTNGFIITGNQLTLRYRVISRVTFIAEKKRIQVVQSKQNYFQKRKNIASIQATVMSGITGATARVSHLNESDVNELLSWFEKSKEMKKEDA